LNHLIDRRIALPIFLRVSLFIAAAGSVVLQFTVFAGTSGFEKWVLIMVAASLAIAGATIGSAWQRAGTIAAIFVFGSTAQLGLTYHPFLPIPTFYLSLSDATSACLIAMVGLQAIVTVWCLSTDSALRALIRFVASLGWLRSMVFGGLMLGVSATSFKFMQKQEWGALFQQFGLAGAFILLNILTVFAFARSLPKQGLADVSDRIMRSVSLPGAAPHIRPLDRYLPALVALWVITACSIISLFAFQRTPHVPDEVAYLFQAKYFLMGRIHVPVPPNLDALGFEFLDVAGDRWFSIFPPGWPLFLALGVFAGLAWLVNPVLAGGSILLAHKYCLRISDRSTANVTILLMAASPWLLAMSGSLMGHTVTLFLLVASWLLLVKSREEGSILSAVGAGALMGLLFLARPLDGLTVGTLTGLWCLTALRDVSGWRIVLGYGLGCVAVGALIFPYDYYLIGDPLAHPINRYFDRVWHPGANRLGFGPDIGPPHQWGGYDLYPGHSPSEAVINAQNYGYSLNTELFGWGTGSLMLVFVHLVWGRITRNDVYMIALCIVLMAVFGLYWFTATYYIGPRYLFLMLLPLTILTVRGIGTLRHRLTGAICAAALPGRRLGMAIALLCFVGAGVLTSYRSVTRYFEARGVHADIHSIMAEHDLRGALVFVRQVGNVWDARADREFGSAFMYNAPDFSGTGPIFARDLGPASNKAVAANYPDRPIYFILGRSKTVDRARLIRGPVTRESL